jgi:gliding motility-associated-like protein
MKKFSLQYLYTSITQVEKRANTMKIFFIAAMLCCFGFSGSAQIWVNVGTPGFSAGASSNTSMAIDASGTPYVVYVDAANASKATVMKYNGTSWVTVGAAGFSANQATYTTIAIDGSGTPYVAYQDGSLGPATVMKYNGTSWITVGSAGFSGGRVSYTSIAIDPSGTPYVGYEDWSAGRAATVMKYNGTSWVLVGSAGFSAGIADLLSMTLSGSGMPYVAYQDNSVGDKATVMTYNGTSWVTVGTAGFSSGAVADNTNMAVDGSGTPYIAFQDNTAGDGAVVMKYNGTSWAAVGAYGFSASNTDYISIAIAGSGTPYVAYEDGVSGPATVKKFNGTSWVTVGSARFSPGEVNHPSIALNPSDTPYVAYVDFANGQKVSSMRLAPTPPITGPGSVCVTDSITLSDALAGGTWSSGNTAIATVGSLTGVVTGIAGGTAVIYYIGTGDTATDVITVNPLPNVYPVSATGGGNYCTGTPCPHIVMSGSDAGISYQLYLGAIPLGTPVAGTGGVIDFGAYCTAGAYSIVATNPATGCTNVMGTVTITIIGSISPISGIVDVCLGYTSTLTDATTGGVWTSSMPSVATIGSATGLVTGVAAGTTIITYTVGSCSATTVVTVPFGGAAPIMGLHDLCQLTTEIVTDADAGGYWSSSLVTVTSLGSGSAIVNAVNSGVASVSYTLPSGCTIVDTIFVEPLPVITTRDETLCAGSSISYSADIGGGTWNSSDPGAATIGSATGIIFGVSSGSSIITYTLPTGCKDTTLVFVNPLPDSIAGVPAMCIGLTTTLTDASGGGGTFSSSNTMVAPVNPSTGVVSGVMLGTAIISYTLPTGCLTTVTVMVNPIPAAITGPDSVCSGSAITLTDAGTGAWSSSNTAIATVDSVGDVTGVSAGTVIITFSAGTGCYSTYSVTVDQTPSAITGTDTLCSGSFVFLSSTPPGGTWTSSNGSVAIIGGGGTIVGGMAGTAVISYTIAHGCQATDTVTVLPVPGPITGTTTFCVGTSTILSDTSTGGTWISSDTAYATVTGDTVTGVAVGTATITYRFPTGCQAVIAVNITPVPTPITGRNPICQGSTDTLTDGIPGGTWTSGNLSEATVGSLSGIVTGLAEGSVVIYYNLGTCNIGFDLNISPLSPIRGPDTVCVGGQITLTDSTNPTTSVGSTWTIGSPAIANTIGGGLDYIVLEGLSPGTTIVTYTYNACSATDTITVRPTPTLSGSLTLCLGDSGVISTLIPGGAWTTSNVGVATITPSGSLVTVHGVGAGTAIISYILPTGCYAIDTVTVNPLPFGISPVSPTLCQRDSLTFTDATPMGTWSSSTPAIASVGSVSGVVTGLSAGSALISYTLSTGCFVTDTVRINPIDTIIGPLNVCIGSAANYYDSTHGGTWSNDNPAVGTIDSAGLFTSIDTGVTNITYYIASTGCQATISVTVDPLPAPITGDSAVCVGQTDTLSDIDPSGTWLSSNTAVATVDFTSGMVTGVSAGTVTITFTLPTGCSVTTSVLVNPLPRPISGNVSLCPTLTDSTQLDDATPGGIWSSTDTTVATVTNTGFVKADTVGSTVIYYTLITTGCFVGTFLTVHPLPVVIIPTPRQICIGGSVTLAAEGAATYMWSPAYALSNTASPMPVASPTVTTTYTVTGTSSFGCVSDTTVTVTVDSLLRYVKIVGKDTICLGTCDTLEASGRDGTHFSWRPATGLSCTICDTVIACPDVSTTYIATAIDAFGCSISVAFPVTIDPIPVLSIAGDENPVIVCRGTPKQIFAFGAYSYIWSPPYFLSCDSCSNPVLTDTFNMIYQLTGYSQHGCKDSISVRVSVLDTNYNRAGDDTVICLGSSAQLNSYSHSVNGNLDIPSYLWLPAAGLNNNMIPDPIATPDTTTLYLAIIKANVCFTDTIPVLVTVDSLPAISISANPDSTIVIAGTMVQLTTSVTPDSPGSYLWTPNIGLSCDTCADPIATPSVNTTYYVTVTSVHGCASTQSITIDIKCDKSEVFIPNTFTPNGDGKNDLFYVSAKGISMITRMSVYNRWGQVVFQANNIPPNMEGLGWDGTYKGIVLEPDVFDYVVEVVCELGATYTYSGNVSIVR